MKNRLKEIRKSLGFPQKEISAFLDVSISTYSRYESNVMEMNSQTLRKLAEYFNVSVDYILCRTDLPNSQPGSINNAGKSKEFRASIKEMDYIKKFRSLDKRGKKCVEDTLAREYALATKVKRVRKS